MREFVDSSDIAGDPEALQARLGRDSYLFFRGLADAATILRARREILETIAAHGWLAPDTAPADAIGGRQRIEGLEGWWDAYGEVIALESVNRVAHDDGVLGIMAALAGEEVVVHPRKIVRIMWPDPPTATPPHQDITHVGGCIDFFTCWTALGTVHRDDGPLKVLTGSHREGVRRLELANGAGGRRSVGVSDDDERWASADFEPGDVVMFHSMTVHAALPNRSGRLRLSVDNRYQGISRPITTWSLAPHFQRDAFRSMMENPQAPVPLPTWDAYTAGWSTKRWIEVPDGLDVVDAPPMAPPRRALGPAEPRSAYVDTADVVGELEAATARPRA